jgi:DNA uptake protein ComE-like DNA-binding protein
MARPASSVGSALVAVLWCLVLLSLTAFSLLRTTRLEVRVVKNQGDLVQAHYLALAGIEKAKALIWKENQELKATGGTVSRTLWDNPEAFRDIPFGRGRFRVMRAAKPEEGARRLVYGISDEESRLDVNLASIEELKRLPGMTEAVAAAIADWRDRDSQVTPQGAEADYYASLSPPYRIRNGPLETIRELLMVRGVSPELLLGEDWNANGLLDPEEDDGARNPPPDNQDGILDAGWSALLTTGSGVENASVRGRSRTDLKTAGEESLASLEGVSPELAKAIVAYRAVRPFETIADLLEVTPLRNQGGPGGGSPPPLEAAGAAASGGAPGRRSGRNAPPPPPPPPAASAAQPEGGAPGGQPGESTTTTPPGATPVPDGPKLVSEELFRAIADDITVDSKLELEGVVNINTAGPLVLATLPGLSAELAQAIVAHRSGQGPFRSIAGLLEVRGMTREAFKKCCPRVCVRSGTFRILSEGVVDSTGARKRLEVVVRLGRFEMETLSYREDL